jgi:hypothetical protein
MFSSQPAYETRVCRKGCELSGVDDDGRANANSKTFLGI